MEKSLLKKSLVVGVICLLMVTSIPIISGSDEQTEPLNGSLADGINMWCESTYLIDIILRNDVFHIMVSNNNDEEIWHRVSITITKPNGEIIFDEFTTTCPHPMKPHSLDFWTFYRFPDFREKGYMFGLFDIYWEFYILNDDSYLKERYRGFIFGIAAIILTPWGKPIE